jgi:hypothetical protein
LWYFFVWSLIIKPFRVIVNYQLYYDALANPPYFALYGDDKLIKAVDINLGDKYAPQSNDKSAFVGFASAQTADGIGHVVPDWNFRSFADGTVFV